MLIPNRTFVNRVREFFPRLAGYFLLASMTTVGLSILAIAATLLFVPEYSVYLTIAIFAYSMHLGSLAVNAVEVGEIPPLGQGEVSGSKTENAIVLVVSLIYCSSALLLAILASVVLVPSGETTWWLFVAMAIPIADQVLVSRIGFSPGSLPAWLLLTVGHLVGRFEEITLENIPVMGRGGRPGV